MIACIAALLGMSTAANVIATIRGTENVVEKYHYTETREDRLTNEDGDTLQCASAEFSDDKGKLASKSGAPLMTLSGGLLPPPPPAVRRPK